VMNADHFDLSWSRRKGLSFRGFCSAAAIDHRMNRTGSRLRKAYGKVWGNRTLVETVNKKSGRRFKTTWKAALTTGPQAPFRQGQQLAPSFWVGEARVDRLIQLADDCIGRVRLDRQLVRDAGQCASYCWCARSFEFLINSSGLIGQLDAAEASARLAEWVVALDQAPIARSDSKAANPNAMIVRMW
jgi:hypothetical protein